MKKEYEIISLTNWRGSGLAISKKLIFDIHNAIAFIHKQQNIRSLDRNFTAITVVYWGTDIVNLGTYGCSFPNKLVVIFVWYG